MPFNKDLESRSIFVLREAMASFKRPVVLWSTGKDSTAVLGLIKDAFGNVPFPVVHIDTGFKFREMYEFRDKIAKEWKLDLRIIKNEKAVSEGMCPEKGKLECCTALKTEALKNFIEKENVDAAIVSIRRDEHDIRSMERYFSPRDKEFRWHIVKPKTKEEMKKGDAPFVSGQQAELWDLYQTDFGKGCSHVRIHPILHWDETDVWDYIREKNIPINPLYFSRGGERYRSLGCMPCTSPIESDAKTIDEIIEELKTTKIKEREGRAQDKEQEYAMEKLRSLGYM